MQGFSSRRDGSSLSTMWLSRLQVPLVSHAILVVMSRTFKKVDYAQALDLTVRLGDCLPPEHLARFVVDSVALLDVSSLYAHYGSRGGEPYARGACYWACFSMAMRLVCSVRVRSSVPRMRQCHSVSSQATSILIMIPWPRFGARSCPN